MLTEQRTKDAIKDLKELHGIPSMGFCAVMDTLQIHL